MPPNLPVAETDDDTPIPLSSVVNDSVLEEEWHGFATEELSESRFFVAPIDGVSKWPETVDKRPVTKRKLSQKSRKERLVGKDTSSRGARRKKQKGTKHHGHVPGKNVTYNNALYAENSENSITLDDTIDSGAPAGNYHKNPTSYFLQDALLAEVEKSWNEVTASLKVNPKQTGHKSIGTNIKKKRKPLTVFLRQIVRAHVVKLMFGRHLTGRILIPWSTLGIWLYTTKKRFINWDTTLPFIMVNHAFLTLLPRASLCKMLLLDLVDWTKDEIQYESPEVPLVVDARGRTVVKIGDLTHLYRGHPLVTYKRHSRSNYQDAESQYESESSTTTPARSSAPSSSLDSDDSSSVDFAQAKRERRKYLYRKDKSSNLVVSGSDSESDSDSGSE